MLASFNFRSGLSRPTSHETKSAQVSLARTVTSRAGGTAPDSDPRSVLDKASPLSFSFSASPPPSAGEGEPRISFPSRRVSLKPVHRAKAPLNADPLSAPRRCQLKPTSRVPVPALGGRVGAKVSAAKGTQLGSETSEVAASRERNSVREPEGDSWEEDGGQAGPGRMGGMAVTARE